MIRLCSISDCTGCGACSASCPHHAIAMKIDRYGFKYPIIDAAKCVECGLCIRYCPILTLPSYVYPMSAMACYALNSQEREKSSSGGLATLLAKEIIRRGGVVYGCAFVPPFSVKHIRCVSEEEIKKLRGSKYVQSDIKDIYESIKKDLKSGLKVLFIGTACQVAAIKSIFYKSENLFVVDIICHGVPSLQFLLDTLPRSRQNTAVDQMEFRVNTKYHFSLRNKAGISLYERPLSSDMYMKGFFNGTIFRSSCFVCRFARKERISDITIGDFWGLKSTLVKKKEKGVSLALINNVKGQQLFDSACLGNAFIEKRTQEEAFAGNEQLNHPFRKNFRVYVFRRLYPYIGYKKALCCALPDKILLMKLKNIFKIK